MLKFHRSFELKLISLCMITLIGIIATIHITVSITTKNIIEHELKQNARGIAVAVAYNVMEDIDSYKTFIEIIETNEDYAYHLNEYYLKMQTFFANIKSHSNVKFIYTEQRIDETTTQYILDAEPIESPYHSAPGEIEANNSEKDAVFLSGLPLGYRLADYDGWGTLLGAHAPIFDADEKVIGIVGVDIDSSHLYNHLYTLQLILFAIYVIILSTILFILVKYSNVLLDPLLKDKLTGAYNKRFLEKSLQAKISIALKENKDLSLLMLDLDHFKNVNDTYGHGFGDKVLSSVSTVIKKSLRQNDNFFRYGGEEFVIIIPDEDEKRAQEIAERIRIAIEKDEIYNEEKNIPVKITISIGVAGLDSSTLSVQEFVDHADKALYAAKKTRNSISLFKSKLLQPV